ncbi:MAG: hypothetical protein ACYCR3_03610 [Acidithiobacillus sp.]|jgi:hypothetical protein|uniref:hypothetical protein n=1 Tax=Acidithiobacillus ferriphilus TaxID=1689834 RepID=UPI002431A762|nr:hypothetical protein [Acidithiobacillus ferriphilus]MBW9248177.1 hypothetical protein [Acidithiobacillus ferriphilus]MBW9254285.1 hypothetical protein [Acidithiobacillus ferriphilus]
MMKAVIDTNVLLVANGQHADISTDCVTECVRRLQAMEKSGVTIIDDNYRILGEYQHKTSLNPPKGVGDVFLKSLLRNVGNQARVEQVRLTETAENCFVEFPDPTLELVFDPPDRKFAAVAHAHPDKPPVLQATDCKWLDWWPALQVKDVRVEFLCPDNAREFYIKKFPDKPLPALPN